MTAECTGRFYSYFNCLVLVQLRRIVVAALLSVSLSTVTAQNLNNTSYGGGALGNNNGNHNSAFGAYALGGNTDGSYNTGVGANASSANQLGSNNTAVGAYALLYSTGSNNTANGAKALYLNTAGTQNTATGAHALYNNTASYNTAYGFSALLKTTSGYSNTATGTNSLYNNTTGFYNVANGDRSLAYNTSGSYNTATGVAALNSNNTAIYNVATGANALYNNTTGYNNTAVGTGALYKNTTGSNNIAVGLQAGLNLTGSNNIAIGHAGAAGQANTIQIGFQGRQTAAFIAGIRGATVPGGVAVFADANGQLGTSTSSKRFKEQIAPMKDESEAILALKPVTFRYKEELDPEKIPQFGLVAEEVEKVNPDLVARDADGKPYTVRYEAVNAMLLNEFLKTRRQVARQDQTIARLQAEHDAAITELQRRVEVLAASVQEQPDRSRIGTESTIKP